MDKKGRQFCMKSSIKPSALAAGADFFIFAVSGKRGAMAFGVVAVPLSGDEDFSTRVDPSVARVFGRGLPQAFSLGGGAGIITTTRNDQIGIVIR